MEKVKISESVIYIGAEDKDLDLFESQYIVPEGISYNSYLIKDEKIVVMDTIDQRKSEEWIENLEVNLGGRDVDYLVISHMEPDHAANIKLLADKYPNMKLVGNAKTFDMLPQFFDITNLEERKYLVKENDKLCIGKHTLDFIMAPMVHWPEVMVTYEETEKILFSADGFGRFGSLDSEEEWTCEARRYYFNIVGKYGMQVQMLLKKAANLDIKMICPLHGPILKENLEFYIDKYNTWSSYEPEEEGILIACASIHGNTMKVAEKMQEILNNKGAKKVVLTDLTREDMAEAIEQAFQYDRVILAASSYNTDVFPCMRQFLELLRSKNYQKRKIGIIENGSWAPSAARCMNEIVKDMKDVEIIEPHITIKSTLKENDIESLNNLADKMLSI